MREWIVLTTKSGENKNGFPVGEFLCRNGIEEAKELAKELNFDDDEIVIQKYNE